MKKYLIIVLIALSSALYSKATVLFPMFVDIAPSYSEGNIPSLAEAGVETVMYSSTSPSFYPKTFEDAVSFFKDVLPGDVKVEETKVGNMRLMKYSTVSRHSSDTIATSGLLSAIYLLEQPDGSFHAGYLEVEIPVEN